MSDDKDETEQVYPNRPAENNTADSTGGKAESPAKGPAENPMPLGGRRKDGKPFKEGNTREDSSYIVGKNRTPEHTRFAKNDERPRGRRPKGKKNAHTEWEEELGRKVKFLENGKQRKVTKARLNKIRAIDNATVKGKQNSIEFVDIKEREIDAKKEANRRYHSKRNEEILHQYVKDRSAELGVDPVLFGDPEELPEVVVAPPESNKSTSEDGIIPSSGTATEESDNGG